MKKLLIVLAVIGFALPLTACKYRPPVQNGGNTQPVVYEEPAPGPAPAPAPVFQRQGKVTAIGNAVINGTGPQAMLMAKRGAKTEALRNLWESVGGLQISSQTTVRDFITESDDINTRAQGYMQGAVEVYNRDNGDGTYECKVELDLAEFWAFIDSQR